MRSDLLGLLRLVLTVVVGTVIAQILWITFATIIRLPTTGVEAWYLVMLGIHIACWYTAWKFFGQRLERYQNKVPKNPDSYSGKRY